MAPLDSFARTLEGRLVVAVDGRGGSGKTELAHRLAGLLGGAVVHSDDVAWWHSRFGWDDVMIEHVLEPVRAGRPVRFRPPGWEPRGRTGWIEVPAGVRPVFIEGVGVSRRSLFPLVDTAIWVQSDHETARIRGLARDARERPGDDAGALARNWDEWEEEEIPFLAADRPWERAHVIVGSTLPHDPATEVVLGELG